MKVVRFLEVIFSALVEFLFSLLDRWGLLVSWFALVDMKLSVCFWS